MKFNKEEVRFEVLKLIFSELHTSRRTREELENRVAFGFSTVFLGLAALSVGTLSGTLASNVTTRMMLSLLVILAMVLTSAFLQRNANLIRINCRAIVKVEQALGLYRDGEFLDDCELEDLGSLPYAGLSVLKRDMAKWGQDDRWQTRWGHMGAILVSGLASILAIWLGHT